MDGFAGGGGGGRFEEPNLFLTSQIQVLKPAGMANIASISTVHELRHTHCSYLFNIGLNTREVMEQMRHTEMRTTEGYAHIFRPETNRKIKKLERLDR